MNPQQSPKDLALIGAGYWGKNLARNFNALGVLHTICDQHQGTLDAFAAGYESVEKAVKLDPVLRSDSIAKVAIAAPAALHYNLVKQSLEAGKDVFVEKPLCLNTAEAEELVELADKPEPGSRRHDAACSALCRCDTRSCLCQLAQPVQRAKAHCRRIQRNGCVRRHQTVGGRHFAHVSAGARIGEKCNFGQNTFVAPSVVIGNNVKVQNNVAIYTGTTIEDDVFLGPSCVLTNVTNPRTQVNRQAIYEETRIQRGATVGANATIVCGATLGRYCFIAAGAVVTKDVPDYALMVGSPARQKGWMRRHGHVLKPDADGILKCPESGLKYRETGQGVLKCLDIEEESPLPSDLNRGNRSYRNFE